MTTAVSTDVVVIGAGPGGYVCAIRLAQLGKQVTVIERDMLGGVCLNWGCIPSKALIYGATLYESIQHAKEMGITAENIKVDFAKMVSWKDSVVKKLTGGIAQLFKAHNIQTVYGDAEFTGPNTLSVKDASGKATTVNFKQCVIATGSRPSSLSHLPIDHDVVMDSTDALSMPAIPKSMVLIGGGVIGLELGIMAAKLGSDVTVIEVMDQLVSGTDKEVADTLAKLLKRRGLNIKLQSKVDKLTVDKGQATLQVTTPKGTETITSDAVLVAVGRKPNTETLGLVKAGVKTNDRGFIPADNQCRTNIAHIFAIGDVVAPPLLAHKASKEGLVAAGVIAGEADLLDYRAMPSAIFTDPEIASVGYTEEQLKQQGVDYKVGKFPFAASGRALSMNDTDGFVKVLADAKTDELLGVHMIGPDVSELIAEAALAIEMGACAEDLALTVHAHPTLPETLMEAAEAIHGKAIHVFERPTKSPRPPAGATV